jgi:hypothetical protein
MGIAPERENIMTNEEKHNKIAKEFTENAEEISIILDVIANVIDDNPEIVANIGHVFVKYWECLTPMFKFVSEDVVAQRKELYDDLVAQGYSPEIAIKLVVGL